MDQSAASPPGRRAAVLLVGIAALAALQCKPRTTLTDAGASPAVSASASAAAMASAAPGNVIMLASPVAMTVDVADLLRDYKGNELRGDNKYKGKRVRIIGKAGEFKRDIANTIYVTVGTGAPIEIPEAQCFFGDEYAGWVASLTKGSTVAIDCTVEGLMINVLMKNCSGIAATDTLNACYKLRDTGIAKWCSPEESGTVFYTSDLPTDRERANVLEAATTLGLEIELAFLTQAAAHDPTRLAFREKPLLHASPTVRAWVERSVGFVFRLRGDVDYEGALAQVQKDALDGDLGKSVGSPSARIVVLLPAGASPDLLPRVKTVVDHLAPASK